VGHAYVLRVVAEFQAFTRDLHDLAAERVVVLANPDAPYRPILVAATSAGRSIDRGNADVRSLEQDFRRLGINGLKAQLAQRNARWAPAQGRGDQAYFKELIDLRNALAHGNQGQLDGLRARGVADTVTWTRNRLPGLDRTARALDRLVWDHVAALFQLEPW
jgi:hypothetical protein